MDNAFLQIVWTAAIHTIAAAVDDAFLLIVWMAAITGGLLISHGLPLMLRALLNYYQGIK